MFAKDALGFKGFQLSRTCSCAINCTPLAEKAVFIDTEKQWHPNANHNLLFNKLNHIIITPALAWGAHGFVGKH